MPQPPAPVTAEAFDLAATPALEAELAASDWLTITPAQRRTRAGNALDALPVIGEWLGGQITGFYEYVLEQIEHFTGPAIPEKPVSDWFGEWWDYIFGEALLWATDPNPGSGL